MQDAKYIKIVYLVSGPLSQRWLDYYRVDEMANCFDVEFWDCSAILDNGYVVQSPLHRDYVVNVGDLADFQQNLKRLPKDTMAVIEIGLVWQNYAILKQASRYIKFGVIIDFWTYYLWDAVKQEKEVSEENQSNMQLRLKIKDRLYTSNLLRFVWKLCKYRSWQKVKSVYYDCSQRKEERDSIKREEKCKSLFHLYEMTYKPHQRYTINHPDYEKYLLIREKKERTNRYVVFIADFYPYHPEIIIREGYKKEQVAKEYYDSINQFFDKVEKQLSCTVVIAEHPSGKWEHNPFNGREIVYYKTAELVRDSIGVCMHASCAFSYVALFNKPVAILYNKELEASSAVCDSTFKMAQALQIDVCNTDTIEDIYHVFLPLDENVRLKYIQTFADADSNRPNADLMKEHFINIHNDIIRRSL